MTIDNVLEILEKHKLRIPSNVFYELKADIVNFEEPTTKNDLGVDCIDRAQAQTEIEMNALRYTIARERGGMGQVEWSDQLIKVSDAVDVIRAIPSVTPQEPRKGEWLRMSDLSEQEDDRYKCSHCGNVVHHKNKMDLYTFNSWCGRCGSDNGRHINHDKENEDE